MAEFKVLSRSCSPEKRTSVNFRVFLVLIFILFEISSCQVGKLSTNKSYRHLAMEQKFVVKLVDASFFYESADQSVDS